MKYCPQCRTEYSDDTLQFCLQDGTPLAEVSSQSSPTFFDTESETVISPKKVEPIHFDLPSSYQTNQTNWEASQPIIIQQEKKKSNTAMVVALTMLGTILLLGIGGIGTWLYLKNNKNQVAVNINAATINRPANANTANITNAANSQNLNANPTTPSPTATATPTAQPTLKPEEAKAITSNVKNVIDDWKSATEDLDLETHLRQYADTVDYYRAGKVGIAKVRADRQRAFDLYDSMNINIKNVKITPDASGEKAIAVFDKEWTFEGEEKYSSGEVQQQLTLNKIGGRWLITGEKELKIYRVEK